MKILMAVPFFMAAPALADVSVQFIEGAPKDRFVITNVNECALTNAQIEINFNDSLGKLIFDVTGAGAGVEVFQPLEIREGREALASVPMVKDGDKSITFDVANLPQKERLVFTIDVDDTVASREITVTNSEMSGSSVTVTTNDNSSVAAFGKKPEVRVAPVSC